MKKYILTILFCLPTHGTAGVSLSLEQRIEQLERRVMLLEQTHSPVKHSETAPQKSEVGYAHLVYWLGDQATLPTRSTYPLASGKFKLSDDLYFHPKAYSINHDGMFSHFSDPSRFPLATLAIDGTLLPPGAGTYQLLVKPTPPREVGGAGNVELAIHIYVDNRLVFAQDYSSTLSPSTTQLDLSGHAVGFRMEVIARSPGFGPSPTRTKVFVGLQGSNAASPEPIGNYLSLPK